MNGKLEIRISEFEKIKILLQSFYHEEHEVHEGLLLIMTSNL